MWGSSPQQSANHQCDVSNTIPIPVQPILSLLNRRRGGVSLVFVSCRKVPQCLSCERHVLFLSQPHKAPSAHLSERPSPLPFERVSQLPAAWISFWDLLSLYIPAVPQKHMLAHMHTSTCTSFCLSSTLLMDSWHQRWPTLVLSVRNKSCSYLRDALVTIR